MMKGVNLGYMKSLMINIAIFVVVIFAVSLFVSWILNKIWPEVFFASPIYTIIGGTIGYSTAAITAEISKKRKK